MNNQAVQISAEELAELRRLAAIGADWERDSSLAKWFPITAEQLKELRRDAKRYRWLRQHRDVMLLTSFFGNGCMNRTVDEVDAAIDAALAKEGK